MSFISAGNFAVTIINALIAEPKFNQENDPNKFDVCLQVREEATGYEDTWRGEVSGKMGMGKASNKTQLELTLNSLKKIGWTHECDFSQLPTLIGMKTVVGVVESKPNASGNVFYNVRYLGSSSADAPVAIQADPNNIAARIAAIQQQSAPVSFSAPAPQPQVAAPAPQMAQPQMPIQQPAPAPMPQATPVIPQVVQAVPQQAVPVQPTPQQAPQVPPMPTMPQATPVAPAQQVPPMPSPV